MMQSNLLIPSALRQQLDLLGAQFDPQTKVDPVLVMTVCRNIAMAATDNTKPLPDDVFAPGWNETLMRCALSRLCVAVVQMMSVSRK